MPKRKFKAPKMNKTDVSPPKKKRKLSNNTNDTSLTQQKTNKIGTKKETKSTAKMVKQKDADTTLDMNGKSKKINGNQNTHDSTMKDGKMNPSMWKYIM